MLSVGPDCDPMRQEYEYSHLTAEEGSGESYLSLCPIAITNYLSTCLACAVHREQSFEAQKMAQQLRAKYCASQRPKFGSQNPCGKAQWPMSELQLQGVTPLSSAGTVHTQQQQQQ